jgi:phosphatidylserine/phosphatidylglycerophosphate/cardiolipin synthase-like enzyme
MKKFVTGLSAVLLACAIEIGATSFTAEPYASATSSASSSSNTIEYYFPRAEQDPKTALIDVIDSAKSSLDVAIYSFTDTDIANAMAADKKRGVTVRVVTDKTESGTKYQKAALKILKSAGIPIKINKHSGLMHLKVTIADKIVATTGSFNYTKAAETKNDEVFVVLNDAVTAKDFESEFSTMWADTKAYADYQ